MKGVSVMNAEGADEAALRKEVARLRAENEVLRAFDRTDKRVAYIAALQEALKERDASVAYLVDALAKATGTDPHDVRTSLVRKTIGGPGRFAPPSREALLVECAGLERQLERAGRALDTLEAAAAASHRRAEAASDSQCAAEAALADERRARAAQGVAIEAEVAAHVSTSKLLESKTAQLVQRHAETVKTLEETRAQVKHLQGVVDARDAQTERRAAAASAERPGLASGESPRWASASRLVGHSKGESR